MKKTITTGLLLGTLALGACCQTCGNEYHGAAMQRYWDHTTPSQYGSSYWPNSSQPNPLYR